MIPTAQTKLHVEGEVKGNCFQACLASVFEIPIESVPEFTEMSDLEWRKQFQDWCIKKFDVMPIDLLVENKKSFGWVPLGYHLINGPSPRGNNFWHSVVGYNGNMIFDPHPSKEGLVSEESWTVFVSSVRGTS